MSFIVAIDGPTSSGKSTLARIISKKFGFVNLQTGAMYRCVAKSMLDNNIGLKDTEGVESLLSTIRIEFKETKDKQLVFLNGEDVTDVIRTKSITDYTSKVASISIVRSRLVEMQREMAEYSDVVIEGRDTGSNVFPNADIKFFLMASTKVRIERRIQELEKNGEKFNYEDVARSMYIWDADAVNREEGALKKTPDAICIDTSDLTIDQLGKLAFKFIQERYVEEEQL